jgi:hypothetical protein
VRGGKVFANGYVEGVMRNDSVRPGRVTIISGIAAFQMIIVLLQLWLFTTTMETFLAGYQETAAGGVSECRLFRAQRWPVLSAVSKVNPHEFTASEG